MKFPTYVSVYVLSGSYVILVFVSLRHISQFLHEDHKNSGGFGDFLKQSEELLLLFVQNLKTRVFDLRDSSVVGCFWLLYLMKSQELLKLSNL